MCAKTEPWIWVLDKKAALKSVFSAGSLALDRLFLFFGRNGPRLLYQSNDCIKFDVNCINLVRRPDKKQFIEKQFAAMNLDLKIFPAVDGLTIDMDQLINNGTLSPSHHCPPTGMPLTPAEVGAYLSHYELWKAALASPNEISLIIEDDALITCDKSTLEEFARNIPEDTDLFFINRRKNKTKHISLYASRFVSKFWGLTAYFITKQGAKKLVELSLPILKSADEFVSELNQEGTINCYCSRKELVVECSNPRDARNFRFNSDIFNRT